MAFQSENVKSRISIIVARLPMIDIILKSINGVKSFLTYSFMVVAHAAVLSPAKVLVEMELMCC